MVETEKSQQGTAIVTGASSGIGAVYAAAGQIRQGRDLRS